MDLLFYSLCYSRRKKEEKRIQNIHPPRIQKRTNEILVHQEQKVRNFLLPLLYLLKSSIVEINWSKIFHSVD